MDRCIIKSISPTSQGCGLSVIRISMDTYDDLIELKSKTGRSITYIADALIRFAMEHVEICPNGDENDKH
ncbi:MAG: hypothetical protein RSC76_05245 [Oscillospiraceae bacterium]